MGGRNHTRGWLHALQTEHERLCCHDKSDSTRRRWCKGNLQPNTWEEVLPVEMSQLLTQNKTNTKIPRKLNRTKHGITPTYLLLLSNFQKSRPQNLWCTKWTACMVNRNVLARKTNKCSSKKRCLSLFLLLLYISFFWLHGVYFAFWPYQPWNTYLLCHGLPLNVIMCSSHHLQFVEVTEEVTVLRTLEEDSQLT